MENWFSYFVLWSSWIIVTFLLDKTKARFFLGLFILSLILILPYSFQMRVVHIGFLWLCMSAIGLFLFVRFGRSQLYLNVFMTFILLCCYTSIRLLQLYDPVWFIYMNQHWTTSVLYSVLCIYLVSSYRERMVLFINGLVYGELLYWIVLSVYFRPIYIGDTTFIYISAISLLIISCWSFLDWCLKGVAHAVQKNIREKKTL
ncbi:hypothetical protein LC087_06365 [Bacillus carboniphilus]|uniref:Integral inner membrane protein n=1 Tax=Bacillus carboniphilus TaxID=86663 RepID=A0ABY9JWJ6_9BACI|nr:hypothetical protein [Bacillus carboniphilus]WLR43750.1 hypothetical protein LC087_06365 [Bacillus carboniphilus]